MDAGGVESFKKVIRFSSVVVRVLTVSSSDIDQIELFHAVIFPESSTFWGNSRVIYGFTLCIFMLIRKLRPQRVQKAGLRPWFLVGTNQTEWKSIVWGVNEVTTWLSLPSKPLSINNIYVYREGGVVFPHLILFFFSRERHYWLKLLIFRWNYLSWKADCPETTIFTVIS